MLAYPDQQELIRFLGKVSLFGNAGDEVLGHLARKILLASYRPGVTVIRKGDMGETMFLIFSGRLKVHDGEHQVARLGQGQFFGELSLLDREPRSMSVTTLEESVLGTISRKDFYAALKEFPDMIQDIISVLNSRLRSQNDVLISEYKSREAHLTEQVRIRTEEIVRQNQIIAEKNKEMTDSLRYASRLQQAILPATEAIRGAFPESFVLYLPKDIVSGDFYSYECSGGRHVLAAADCTGHGVAGAIMSMIGSSLLKQIILEKSVTDPAEILKQLSEGVIESLRQAENSTNDGMDIALCCLDPDTRTLRFAGANRPLWMIRNGELQVIPSDKFPIGGLQMERSRPFHTHDIPLLAGDLFYIFSDGYSDQFGGSEGKKLMTKRFRELLLSVHHRPMSEQGTALRDFIGTWKGHLEQLDDILVIGFRYHG
jgi:serine phosphatase RsbU (regulator of sigma subunit)